MYGITETMVHTIYRPIRAEDARGQAQSPIGVPLSDLSIELLDPEGMVVPDGQVGEIWVSGAGVTSGYIERPELTAHRFQPEPRRGEGALRYRSGDLRVDDAIEEALLRVVEPAAIAAAVEAEAQAASRRDPACSQLGSGNSFPSSPRTRGRSIASLPAWKPILPAVRPQRWPSRSALRECSVSMPAARQNRSKDADTSSHALPTGAFGIAFVFMVNVFMALLSFRGISTPSLPAQGEQRRSSDESTG
jgi:hypothetical protein